MRQPFIVRTTSAYDNPEKRKTREIWYGKYLREERAGGIVMLAGDTPNEVRTAVRHGFKLENITPVDHDYDNLEKFMSRLHGKEREQMMRTALHCEVSEACRELALNGHYQRVVSLDFCGNVDQIEVRAEMQSVLASGVLKRGGKLVVEVLDGREQDMERFSDFLQRFDITEEIRLWNISPYIRKPMTNLEVMRLKLLRMATYNYDGLVVPIGIGKYQNGPSPMLWIIYDLKPSRKRGKRR